MWWNDCVRACDKNVQRTDRMGIGSCTITMPSPHTHTHSLECPAVFGKKQNGGWWLCSTTHPHPLLTQPHSLWLCFVPMGEAGFERKAFCWCCWHLWELLVALTAFPLKIFGNVSSIGSSTGITASCHRGSTLNGTIVSYFLWIL